MPKIFISHSSKDDLVVEALRAHLKDGGRAGDVVFVDHAVSGIGAHEQWKDVVGQANSASNVLICLVSPEWLDSKECEVERRVFETIQSVDRHKARAILVVTWGDVPRDDVKKRFGGAQIVMLDEPGKTISLKGDHKGRSEWFAFNEEALRRIERSLRELGATAESFEWQPRPNRPSPYPGLEAFSEQDAGVFFGRDAEIAATLGTIDAMRGAQDGSRIMSVIAASGVGKSSFLRAGLWPRLKRQAGISPLVVLRPGTGILTGRDSGLRSTMAHWFNAAGQSLDPAGVSRIVGDPLTPEGFAALLKEAARSAPPGDTLVIGIDQAEELFDTGREAAARNAEARAFLDALFSHLARPDGTDLLAIFTIRADSYDPLALELTRATDRAEAAGAPRIEALKQTPVTLNPMLATSYRDVINRPAKVDRNLDTDVFAPALVDHLIATFTGRDALPLLSMTLEQLYDHFRSHDRITLADYREVYRGHDGAEGPVRQALTTAYRIAGAAGTEAALQRLLIPGLATWDPAAGESGAAKRRIAVASELIGGDAELAALADALAHKDVRLLTRARGDHGPTLEVAHEALLRIEPVRGWIARFADDLRLRDELEREAAAWAKAEQGVGAALAALPPIEGETEKAKRARLPDAIRTAQDAALAARRGPRLDAATALLAKPQFAELRIDRTERPPVAAFLEACTALETTERDTQRRIIGRAFVKPSKKALEDGLSDHALRLAASGVLLAKDLGFDPKVDTQLWGPALRAIFENRTRAVLHLHSGAVFFASFSPYGQRIVTASDDKTARIWDVSTGIQIARLEGHTDWVRRASFSPDGQLIVTASDDKSARIWDASTGKQIARLEGHTDWVLSASFSPDGQRIVTAADDNSARIWDAATGKQIAPLDGHTGLVLSASFSPDGKRIVTASDDNSARIWDAATGRQIAQLDGQFADRGRQFGQRRIVEGEAAEIERAALRLPSHTRNAHARLGKALADGVGPRGAGRRR